VKQCSLSPASFGFQVCIDFWVGLVWYCSICRFLDRPIFDFFFADLLLPLLGNWIQCQLRPWQWILHFESTVYTGFTNIWQLFTTNTCLWWAGEHSFFMYFKLAKLTYRELLQSISAKLNHEDEIEGSWNIKLIKYGLYNYKWQFWKSASDPVEQFCHNIWYWIEYLLKRR
jgi:hypothetical protein